VVDRATGRIRRLPVEGREGARSGGIYAMRFDADGRLLSAGEAGVRSWDLDSGEVESLLARGCGTMDASAGGRRIVVGCLTRGASAEADGAQSSEVFLLDPETGDAQVVTGHGDTVQAVAIDPSGMVIATGDTTGVVRVSGLEGAEPHLLLGASGVVSSVDFSPDGRWVAAAAGPEVWLWPMPDLSRRPLHTRPLPELMAKLDSLTNVELVPDESTPTGYRSEVRPFPGWETPPTW
jgi:WD40 repeat protein